MSDLKPCPFCGGQAIRKWIGNDSTKKRAVAIGCSTSGCTVQLRVAAIRNSHQWCDEQATLKWNNRCVPVSGEEE